MLKNEVKKYVLITLGTITLSLGVIGIFLPIIPTTPFLLITSYCYLRSSKSLHTWLLKHPILGRYIKDYLEHRTVSRKIKVVALGTLWPSLVFTIFQIPLVSIKILLAIIGTMVSLHIIKLRERPAI